MKTVSIYTDGACKGNPGPGGFAAILKCEDHTRELTGSEPHTTNNRMELRAILAGLAAITRPAEIVVYSDSLYATGALTGNKIKANADLICEGFVQLARIRKLGGTVDFQHVNGHAGDPLNARADKLASNAAILQKGP
jgi:ribonuclease HI